MTASRSGSSRCLGLGLTVAGRILRSSSHAAGGGDARLPVARVEFPLHRWPPRPSALPRTGDEQSPDPADPGHRPGRPGQHPQPGGLRAEMLKTRVALGYCSASSPPKRAHTPTSARSASLPSARRRRTRLAYRSRLALPPHRQSPGSLPAAPPNSRKPIIAADSPEGRLIEVYFTVPQGKLCTPDDLADPSTSPARYSLRTALQQRSQAI